MTAPITHPTWMDDALCAQTDPELWFPEKGESATRARQICGQCPIRQRCAEYALETGQEYGVWGGLNAAERSYLTGTASANVTEAMQRRLTILDLDKQGIEPMTIARQVRTSTSNVRAILRDPASRWIT